MTKEEIRQEAEEQCNEEEYFRKNYPDSCYGDRPLSPYWDFFQDGVEFGERQSKNKIADIKANCDLAIEGRDVKIMELEEDYKALQTSYNILKDNDEKIIKEMGEQIEKMRCCSNCNGHCSWTSESIKDGKRTSHYWNEEKQAYCDVGEGAESEYQLWEMRR